MLIDEIVKSASQMSVDEIKERLKEIRNSRSVSKEVTSTKRPTKAKEKAEGDILSALKEMTPEQKAQLLDLLGGK